MLINRNSTDVLVLYLSIYILSYFNISDGDIELSAPRHISEQ